MLSNNIVALLITFSLALAWLRINDFAAHRGWISSDLSRKIIHTGTGPIYVLCWLLFNDAPSSRYLAALIPLMFTIQFFLVGAGIIKDDASVSAMSRSGDRREILRGPLYYGIVHVVVTLLFWKDHPAAVVALMLMCGGDGLADIIGRRYGSIPLPWNKKKSWAGTLAMFLGGLVFSGMIMAVFVAAGVFSGTISYYLPGLIMIAIAGTIIETLPVPDFDNFTVTTGVVILALLLW